jgi:tRNA pseudouridine55 synthase
LSGDAAPGFLLVDKPAGVTSHDVVARVRRERGGRVGHAGTLDPFATGLLIVLLGAATRLQRYVLGLPKTYVATARLGWRSSTGDSDGELDHTGRIPDSLALPTGRIEQTPPMTSAVRVDVERPTREVEIHRAELLEHDGEDARFEIECSSGTYVRTLIETLGDAYCAELRRTAIGPHRLADAGDAARPVESLLSFLPDAALDPEAARLVRNGVRIDAPAAALAASGEPVQLTSEGRLVAVGRADEAGLIRTDMVMPD